MGVTGGMPFDATDSAAWDAMPWALGNVGVPSMWSPLGPQGSFETDTEEQAWSSDQSSEAPAAPLAGPATPLSHGPTPAMGPDSAAISHPEQSQYDAWQHETWDPEELSVDALMMEIDSCPLEHEWTHGDVDAAAVMPAPPPCGDGGSHELGSPFLQNMSEDALLLQAACNAWGTAAAVPQHHRCGRPPLAPMRRQGGGFGQPPSGGTVLPGSTLPSGSTGSCHHHVVTTAGGSPVNDNMAGPPSFIRTAEIPSADGDPHQDAVVAAYLRDLQETWKMVM